MSRGPTHATLLTQWHIAAAGTERTGCLETTLSTRTTSWNQSGCRHSGNQQLVNTMVDILLEEVDGAIHKAEVGAAG